MVKNLTNPFRDLPLPLGSLITAAGQRLSAELDGALRTAGYPDLRASHAPIFMAIDPDGTRVTDLAQRAKMTKQAAGELIRYLMSHGYLASSVDPSDHRAKVVRLTDSGWQAVRTGEGVITRFDAWLGATVGERQVRQLRSTLQRIIDTPPDVR